MGDGTFSWLEQIVLAGIKEESTSQLIQNVKDDAFIVLQSSHDNEEIVFLGTSEASAGLCVLVRSSLVCLICHHHSVLMTVLATRVLSMYMSNAWMNKQTAKDDWH